MQFYGRIDVGQLMTRATADPQMVQAVIQNMLSELDKVSQSFDSIEENLERFADSSSDAAASSAAVAGAA